MLFTILIIEKKKKLYTEIYYFNKNIVDINYRFLQTPKKELVEIFWSKKEVFLIKGTI